MKYAYVSSVIHRDITDFIDQCDPNNREVSISEYGYAIEVEINNADYLIFKLRFAHLYGYNLLSCYNVVTTDNII